MHRLPAGNAMPPRRQHVFPALARLSMDTTAPLDLGRCHHQAREPLFNCRRDISSSGVKYL